MIGRDRTDLREDRRALQSLRNALVLLRKALGPEGGRIRSPARDALTLDLAGAEADVVRFDTGVQASKLMPLHEVVQAAQAAQAQGATRFCMGAAWRSPKQRDMERVTEMVREVKALGLETCMTLGMLDGDQACALKNAGLDYYNHNLDSAPEFYGRIISTRSYQDRLDTLAEVHFQRGDRDQALQLMKKCIELDPKNRYFRDQLKRFEAGDPKAPLPESPDNE